MPKEFSRSRRVAELVQRELADLIAREIKDPRVGMVTITGVQLSRDLSQARVFVTALNEQADPAQAVAALNHAAGFLRHGLGTRMDLRGTPRLRFEYDSSVQRGLELSELIDRAVRSDHEPDRD